VPRGQAGSFERLSGAFGRLGPAGKIAVLAGAVIACVALLTLAASLLGEESGSGRPASSTTQSATAGELRGACTLTREDGALEQITLTGKPVSKRFCRAFASYLEETTGVEETTWSTQAPAKPLARENCSHCTVKPACRVSIAGASRPREPILFTVESEEAYDELHYDSTYAHDICELLQGRVEIQRFISHAQTG
jgi:hypothetical protein